MTFIVKISGDRSRTTVAEYECPTHGRFAREVARDENGDPPVSMKCPEVIFRRAPLWGRYTAMAVCCEISPYRISAPLCRVRLVEAIRGKSDKPPSETWLDTSNVGEGQPLYEFREDRAAIRERQRQREYIELKKRGDL